MEKKEANKALVKFLKIKNLIFKNFVKLTIAGIIGISIGLLKSCIETPIYKASSTFVLEGGKSKGGSALNIARSFGLNIGGGNSLSSDLLTELIKSRVIIQGTLKKKVSINEEEKYLIQHYLKKGTTLKSDSKWPELFKNFNSSNITPEQEKALNKITSQIIKKNITALLGKKSGLIKVDFDSQNEEFSVKFLNEAIKFLDLYYKQKSNQKERETYTRLVLKTDSILDELNEAEIKLAEFKDSGHSIFKAQAKIDELRLSRNVRVLNLMYGESLKSMELAKYTLDQNKEIIQIIDPACLPIKPKKTGLVLSGLIFGILSIALVLLYLLIKEELKIIAKSND